MVQQQKIRIEHVLFKRPSALLMSDDIQRKFGFTPPSSLSIMHHVASTTGRLEHESINLSSKTASQIAVILRSLRRNEFAKLTFTL